MRAVKNFSFDYYGDNVINHELTLSQGLDLGNNFTFNHFIQAVKESSEYNVILDYLGECDFRDTCTIIAKGRRSVAKLKNHCLDEIYSALSR